MQYNKNGVGEIEVCADDTWHVATMDVVKNSSDVARSITMHTKVTSSTTVEVTWSLQKQSSTLNFNVSSFDVSCTSEYQGRTTEARVVNIEPDVTTTRVEGLLPDTSYECCVTTHTLLTPPVDIQSSTCMTLKTLVDTKTMASTNQQLSVITGVGTALGFCVLLLVCIGCVAMLICCTRTKQAEMKQQTRYIRFLSVHMIMLLVCCLSPSFTC